MRRCLIRTLICATIFLCNGLPKVVASPRPYNFQKKVLDNGLTVLSLEDHSCLIAAVLVWYHVGSKDEDAGGRASRTCSSTCSST